jgi:hypothetical protein
MDLSVLTGWIKWQSASPYSLAVSMAVGSSGDEVGLPGKALENYTKVSRKGLDKRE